MAPRLCPICPRYAYLLNQCRNCNARIALEVENKNLQSKIVSKAKDLQEAQSQVILQAKDVRESQFKVISQAKDLQSRLNFLRQRFDSELDSERVMKADVAILVQDRKDDLLYAHKFVLVKLADLPSCKMFEANMLESKTGFVRIEDATLAVMRVVIEFCYNAEINLTADVTFEEVLEVAHKYGIDLLVKICEERLIPTISNVNLPNMLKLSKKYEVTRLHAHAVEYFKTHFEDVIVNVVEALC